MEQRDVVVIGGGISGAAFALHAARAGRRVLVLEGQPRTGGCLSTARGPEGFWFELGAHTCYNSYGAFLELLEGAGLLGELQPRGKSVLRFLDGDQVLPGRNLGLLLRQFDKLELLRALPRWWGASQEGQTVRSYYARLVGTGNYERVLGRLLSAVPSQRADDFPAGLLFKRRPRRKDVLRSFTLRGGLGTAVERLLAQPGIEVLRGRRASGLARAGEGFAVTLAGGERFEAALVALAVSPSAAAGLLESVLPEVAAELAGIGEVRLDSLGFAVRKQAVRVPYASFLIPLEDVFHSIVTRDVVADPEWRGFSVHFRPGLDGAARRARAAAVLGIRPGDMEAVSERSALLPAPVLGHAERIARVERGLAGRPLALTGNWFGGLSIEDCALRSRAEWGRVAGV